MDCEKEMQKAMSRFQKIAAQLEANSLDAMLITSAPNRFYATGFASSDGTAVIRLFPMRTSVWPRRKNRRWNRRRSC